MHRRMIRSLLGPLTVYAILLPGCGGSSGTGPDDDQNPNGHYIRFKADGVQKEYTDDLLVYAFFTQVNPEYVFAGEGVGAGGSITDGSISLSAMDVAPITTKTYGSYQLSGSGWTVGQILYRIGGVQYETSDVPSDVRVTLTQIGASEVRGTFSGTVKATGRPSIAISAGEFFLLRH
jgi:hypothetical protein